MGGLLILTAIFLRAVASVRMQCRYPLEDFFFGLLIETFDSISRHQALLAGKPGEHTTVKPLLTTPPKSNQPLRSNQTKCP